MQKGFFTNQYKRIGNLTQYREEMFTERSKASSLINLIFWQYLHSFWTAGSGSRMAKMTPKEKISSFEVLDVLF